MMSRLSVADVSGAPDISGLVRVSMVTGIVFPDYDDFLAAFHRRYPRIEIESQEMRSADVVASLQQKSAIVGLSPRRALPKKVESRIFLRQRYALYCGRYHRLFGQRDVTLSDLIAEPFVSFSGDRVGVDDLPRRNGLYRAGGGVVVQCVRGQALDLHGIWHRALARAFDDG